MSIEQLVIQKLQTLSPEKQQEVLDFVEFLQSKTLPEESSNEQGNESASFLTLAQKWVGCVDAPSDLSTNKKYLDGYGNE